MRKACFLTFVTCALAGSAWGQEKAFDWVRANAEAVQLDPADYHTGRVYRPGPRGGNIHVDIQAKQPVTIALTWIDEWNAALQHPETSSSLEWRCLREHVVSTTYVCDLPPERPMVLILHDERTAERALLTGLGAVLRKGGAKQFVSPNDVQITYYGWTCVENCYQPQFQWFRLLKEKYELTSVPKVYSLLTPERDGQQLSVKIKAPVPMTVAVLPSKFADQVYDDPKTLPSVLSNASCKQRGIQSLTFECALNVADGPQSVVVLPEPFATLRAHKKAEIELQTVKCVLNCASMTK